MKPLKEFIDYESQKSLEKNNNNDKEEKLEEGFRKKATKKEKNSSKVVRETTEELFGKEGSARPLADKIFKIFKKELRIKAKDLGVSLGQVRSWRIVLKDFDSPKVNTNINGKKNN